MVHKMRLIHLVELVKKLVGFQLKGKDKNTEEKLPIRI
jgi:hypothetical protein